MSGFDLCDRIKKLDGRLKASVMSAFDPYSDELRDQFLSLKIERFIPKPIPVAWGLKVFRSNGLFHWPGSF